MVKKLLSGLTALALVAGGFLFAPTSNTSAADPEWNVTGDYVFQFEYQSSNYAHDVHLGQNGSGQISGNGGYPAGGAHTYTWVIDSGTVSGNTISFSAHYTASADAVTPLTTMTATGTVASNGTMSGTWSDNYQGGTRNGTWMTSSGTADPISDNTTVIVTPTATQGWSSTAPLADTRPGGAVNFVADANAPEGDAALQLTTDATTTSKAQYMHLANSTQLDDVAELSYYTYQTSASFEDGAPSYQLVTCLGGLDSGAVTAQNPLGCVGFTTFVYEPYQNGTVNTGAWQMWDVDAGQFWSSRTYDGTGACDVTAGGGGAPFYTLAGVKTNCPDAVVVSFGVNIGSNNPSYNVMTDLVQFNDTIYDFELVAPTYTVTINKFVDGTMATTTSANNTAFPMSSTWTTTNIGSGSGTYTLNPSGFNSNGTAYQAVTSEMAQGASYTTSETLTGEFVGASCSENKPFALVGYSYGATLAEAQAATKSTTAPSFTNITEDKVVIVWNQTCEATPPTATENFSVEGGGNITGNSSPKGKKLFTFEINVMGNDLDENSGTFTWVDHTAKKTCTFTTFSNLDVNGSTATFTASGAEAGCGSVQVSVTDNGKNDTITVGTTEYPLSGGNIVVMSEEL